MEVGGSLGLPGVETSLVGEANGVDFEVECEKVDICRYVCRDG